MAINKNHEFEEVNGIKCAIVEKNADANRVAFLKEILELNQYTVVTAPSPPPKNAAAPTEADTAVSIPPSTFTIGVTDLMFNPVNAIFGRILRTRSGRVVTQAYWDGREATAHDEIPYYENL